MSTATATRSTQIVHHPNDLDVETLVIEARIAGVAALCVAFLARHQSEWDTPTRRVTPQ